MKFLVSKFFKRLPKGSASEEQAALHMPHVHECNIYEQPTAFAPFASHSRKALVYRYHPTILPTVLSLLSAGSRVEVFEAPKDFTSIALPNCSFSAVSFLEDLATRDLLFNEEVYVSSHQDIREAIAGGHFQSGFEHYTLFGQFEGREPFTDFSGGVAEYDTIVFHCDHSQRAIQDLGGRFQTHHRIVICGSAESLNGSFPQAARHVPGMAIYYSPPLSWLGTYIPARIRSSFGTWPYRTQERPPPPSKPLPRISVIVPTFNQARFIEATLQSILQQGYPNLELIVIDGGSNDGTLAIIENYRKHIYHFESEKDRGQSHAINKGMAKATGDLLTWLNSDDRFAPNALFSVAEAFRRHSVDIVVGRCARVMDPEKRPYHTHRCALSIGIPQALPLERLLQLQESWLKGEFFHQPEVVFSRSIWEKAGAHVREDLYFSMDYELWVRFAGCKATIVSIPEVIALFRQHPEQKTGGNDLPFLPELTRVNAELTARFKA